MTINDNLIRIAKHLVNHSYFPMLVGGCVRDMLLCKEPKDFDFEVFGADYADLAEALEHFGKVSTVGKSFGVVKLRTADGGDYDFSLPRVDTSSGSSTATRGRGILATFDKSMSIRDAAVRRDFTINSMSYDILDGKLYDFFGGKSDLDNGILRAVSKSAFAEDPLRVLRGMQFAARFNMVVDQETARLCHDVRYADLTPEREYGEWEKLFKSGTTPSKGLQYLLDTGMIDRYIPIKDMLGCPQEPEWHPEGDVYTHTCLAVDNAAKLTSGLAPTLKLVVVAAALAHDFGKPKTTEQNERKGKMRWTSHGHHVVGAEIADKFYTDLGFSKHVVEKIVKLVEYHMDHINYRGKNTELLARTLSRNLHPATIYELSLVMESDSWARGGLDGSFDDHVKEVFNISRENGYWDSTIQPLIKGRDLLKTYPSLVLDARMSKVLHPVNEAFYSGKINTLDEALTYADPIVRRLYLPVNGDDVIAELGIQPGKEVGAVLNRVWSLWLDGKVKSRDEALMEIKNGV